MGYILKNTFRHSAWPNSVLLYKMHQKSQLHQVSIRKRVQVIANLTENDVIIYDVITRLNDR